MSTKTLAWLGVPVAVLAVLLAGFYSVYRPWARTWGATAHEIHRAMPGDELVAEPSFTATRAVTIAARPGDIWPWIVQMGYRKAGFYSYDRLDNDGVPSARRIVPHYQALSVGDTIPLSASVGAVVHDLRERELLLLVVSPDSAHVGHRWTWVWGLHPVDSLHTRLVTRLRVRESFLSSVMLDAFEIIMMRKHLIGIKGRAEGTAQLQRPHEARD